MDGKLEKTFISAVNNRKRVVWARQKKTKRNDYWKTVVFTDESKIKVDGSAGLVFVWRKSTEEWLPCCTIGTVKNGGTSLMVWAAYLMMELALLPLSRKP